MLHGPIWDKILQFALPVAVTVILGQLFNAADIAVILFFGRPLISIFNSDPQVVEVGYIRLVTLMTALLMLTAVLCCRPSRRFASGAALRK